MGLPGAGKTIFADMLAARLGAARVNADFVRENINRDLGFSDADRIEQAVRIANITNLTLTGRNRVAIVDFVNPNINTQEAFKKNVKYSLLSVWMDTIKESRFPNTNKIYQPPIDPDLVVSGWHELSSLADKADAFAHHVHTMLVGNLRRYHLRFNINCNANPSIPQKWRILDVKTGEEKLARSFFICSSQIFSGSSYDNNGMEKWNIEIFAALFWEGEHAIFLD